MTQQGVTVTGPAPGWAAIRFQPARKGNLKVTVVTTSRSRSRSRPRRRRVARASCFIHGYIRRPGAFRVRATVIVQVGLCHWHKPGRDCHRLGVSLSLGPPAAVAGPGRRRQLEVRAQAVPSRIEYFNPRWQRGCCSLGNGPPALVFKGPG
jgi:hypothetical protein